MATSSSAPDPSRAKRLVIGAGLLVLTAAAIAVVSLRPRASPPEKPAPATKNSEGTPPYPIPSFERPEEAKRYFEAMIQGDTRAIEELDRALAKAREQPDPTPGYVEQLERVRAERVDRLEAHRAARSE